MDYSELDDNKLAVAAKTDAKAIETLLIRYKSMVASIARSYFLNGGDNDDLLQEGMIGISKAVLNYNGETPFKPYAIKCVLTSILSAVESYNSKKNKPLWNFLSLSPTSDSDDDDKTIIVSDIDGNPEESFINKESYLETANRIIEKLSKFEYNVLTLYLEGYSYEDMGQKTGKNVKSIANAIQRIRNKLSILRR